MPQSSNSPNPIEKPSFYAWRVALSLSVGFLIAWIVGSATWNAWHTPGVPILKGIILLVIGMIGYAAMDRRIMGEYRKHK